MNLGTIRQAITGVFAYNEYETKVLENDGDSNLIKVHSKQLQIEFRGKTIEIRTAIVPNQNYRTLGPEVVDELPIIFCIHGLGGQLNQFEYLLDNFSYCATTVAIDLPGHGKSPFVDTWDIYETESFVEICKSVLHSRLMPTHKNVFVVGHSMGSIIAVKLAQALGNECIGIAAIAPAFKNFNEAKEIEKKKSYLYYVPTFLFDIFRASVRVGGTDSKSVKSLISPNTTDISILTRQLRVNLQSHSKTWLRTAYGVKFLTAQDLSKVAVPAIAIAAEQDKICPASSVKLFQKSLPENIVSEYNLVHHAGHAVIIEQPPVVAAMIMDFLNNNVNKRLNLTWQLQYIANKTDKWSLKNEKKWRETQSVGKAVKGLRGMKTLRQGDSDHSPEILESNYPDIVAVIDISREKPPYEPKSFKRIKYCKFPTMAKIPPTVEEVNKFIELVDSLNIKEDQSIGVHCHYGFNRTGFFICSYLIDRKGMTVQQALDAYRTSRPSGIHHVHFIDELHLRHNR